MRELGRLLVALQCVPGARVLGGAEPQLRLALGNMQDLHQELGGGADVESRVQRPFGGLGDHLLVGGGELAQRGLRALEHLDELIGGQSAEAVAE